MIPLSIPNFEGNEKKYINKAIEQGWVSTAGAYITEFEEKLAAFLNVPTVVACQSGTSALHLALIESGVTPQDLVIVPALTFIATVNPVRYLLAEPVFMDCDESLSIDPTKLLHFCEKECFFKNNKLIHKSGKQIKAIIVVHVFGNMANMNSIMPIAQKYHLKVIEDATEALGTFYTEGPFKNRQAGTIGDYGCYSFNGNKIITTGGGGAITAKNSSSLAHIKYLSTQAKDDALFYIHNEIGYNYRMTNLQAALGVAQLEMLKEFIIRKQRNFEKYEKHFKDFKYAKLLPFRKEVNSNKWFYSLKIDENLIQTPIKEIIKYLQNKNIQTRPIWKLVNQQKPYQSFPAYKIEKAQYYSNSIINIPCSTQITDLEIETVVNEIKSLLSSLAAI